MAASPVGPVDQLFLHVQGMVGHLFGFHVHWWGWDGLGFDVGHCRDRLQLWDIRSRFRFGTRIRLRFWHVGLWCRVVHMGRFWFGHIWSGFHIGCWFWLRVGNSRDGLQDGIGCIRSRFGFRFHIGGWLCFVHRLGIPVVWLGLYIGHWFGFVRWPGLGFWPVHWRGGLPVVWLGLHIRRWFWISWFSVIGISFIVVLRFSIRRIIIPV